MKTLNKYPIFFSLSMFLTSAAYGQSITCKYDAANGDLFLGIDPGIQIKFTF